MQRILTSHHNGPLWHLKIIGNIYVYISGRGISAYKFSTPKTSAYTRLYTRTVCTTCVSHTRTSVLTSMSSCINVYVCHQCIDVSKLLYNRVCVLSQQHVQSICVLDFQSQVQSLIGSHDNATHIYTYEDSTFNEPWCLYIGSPAAFPPHLNSLKHNRHSCIYVLS